MNNVEQIKERIQNTFHQYEDKSTEEKKYWIDDQLLWEVLLLAIRGQSIYYLSNKKKKNETKEKTLFSDLSELQKFLDSTNIEEEKKEIIGNIDEIKNELE